ncbi:CPBP family intramembrane glutamic endopeptidase [Roseobacter sp.]|uniref:CPBP family intramembrane glutamic endopeptidase n=1 Tax=Roseobacter sp. TaxID=1907202 RepID=UPI0025E9AF84|nr:CPBP family intramembrane glutamic endopeptidase [Roseobacter sp.]
MQFPDYRAYRDLTDPARTTAQVWRLIVGLILVAGVYLICNQLMFRTILTLLGQDAFAFFSSLSTGSTPVAMIVLLMSFGFLTLGVAIAVKVAHKRGITSVYGDVGLAVRQFVLVIQMLVLLNVVVFLLPPWGMGMPIERNLAAGTWVMFLPFAIIAVFVQVSAEEILFRGYIQQQLAARFRSPLIWMLVPAGLFGLGHYMPQDTGENATLIALWAVAFGVLMADLTARSGTLGPAIAVHLANNVVAIVVVSLPDSLSGLSLYLAPFSMADADAVRSWLPVDFAMMIVSWLAARLALRR